MTTLRPAPDARLLPVPFRITPGMSEPPHGSVIMCDGLEGTAYQKHFTDGKYHGTNGKVVDYSYFIKRYDPKKAGDFIILVGPVG